MTRLLSLLLLCLCGQLGSPLSSPLTSRRQLLFGAPAAVVASGAFAAPAFAAPAFAGPPPVVTALGSVDEAVALIEAETDSRFIDGIKGSGGGFLYRGVAGGGAPLDRPCLVLSPPDLLDPSTYGSADAAEFFRALDAELAEARSPVRPRNGHIATPDSRAAASWGQPASIWPLGTTHFAYYRGEQEGRVRGTLLYPPPLAPAKMGGVGTERLAASTGLVVDDDLVGAIRDGDEVMFAATRREGGGGGGRGGSMAFVAVPLALEGELRAGLGLRACKAGVLDCDVT